MATPRPNQALRVERSVPGRAHNQIGYANHGIVGCFNSFLCYHASINGFGAPPTTRRGNTLLHPSLQAGEGRLPTGVSPIESALKASFFIGATHASYETSFENPDLRAGIW